MLNRREILSSLAGLPLIGFLFGTAKSDYLGDNRCPEKLITTAIKSKTTEFSNQSICPYIHIPQENGMSLAIPLRKDFVIYEFDYNKGWQSPTNKTIRYIDGILEELPIKSLDYL